MGNNRRYEVALRIIDKDSLDDLILALVHQGYSVYYNNESGEADHGVVCFTATSDEVHELK